ncbi:MAG: peptidylprolyl isomerase, partial [Holosporaceae bacterium]|nr:peptidylprolyl isomerase [Holosporaceae bacterium]
MRVFFYISFMAFSFFSCLGKPVQNSNLMEYDGIIAVVNDDIITSRDLEERVRLTLFSVGSDASPELKAQISGEVLREMIQEKLRWQCARKYTPKGGWVTDDAVKSTFANIAKRNSLDYDGFCKLLESKHIDKNILLKQIRVNLSWMAYINARFGKFINISESETNRTAAEMKEKQDKETYYVHRMFFPVSDPKNEGGVLSHVNNLMHMLSKGADFNNLARQFSQGADASKGGEIGWVFPGQLSPEENSALGKMSIGERIIVRNSRGYVILFLKDKKEAGLKSFTILRFVQVVIPFREPNPSKEDIEQLAGYLVNLKRNSKNCLEFIKDAKNSGLCAASNPISIAL